MYLVMNSKRIQELREEKGLSRRELAEAAGISMDTLRRVEREEPVSLKTAFHIAEVLEVPHPRAISQPHYTPEELPDARAYAAEILLSPHA
jgi:transcriptional regulator with XRE-family HTH domain